MRKYKYIFYCIFAKNVVKYIKGIWFEETRVGSYDLIKDRPRDKVFDMEQIVRYASNLYRKGREGVKMINIAICDDEITILKSKFDTVLKKALFQSGMQGEITYYNDGSALLDDFKCRRIYDIVILDIDMPSINGKELAKKLRAIDSEFTLAFFTAYEKEVFSAIPIGISAFIPKNFDNDRILSALTELFKSFLSKKPQYDVLDVLINGNPTIIKLQASNIYYFQSVNRNITVHTYDKGFLLIERTFDKIIKQYLSKGFYKINRTCLVNVAKVYEILDDSIIMDNGDKLMVSRRAKKGLIHEITLLPTIKEGQ